MFDAFSSNFPLFFLCLFMAAGNAFCDAAAPARWCPLNLVQEAVGVTNFIWDGDSLCFSNQQQNVRFYQGRRRFEVNGTTLWLNTTPDGSVNSGNWRLAGIDFDLLQLAILPQAEGTPKPLRVMIDPGHGGADTGAIGKNPSVREKDLTLVLAKKLGAKLKKAGMHVDYTRSGDTTLSLDERTRLARKKKADLFVSVHANHAGNTEAVGVETYILPPSGYPGTAEGSTPRGWQIGNRNDYHNTLLGYSIHRHLAANANSFDRGLKRQAFFVLRETCCPAVLIEFGFLSNQTETFRMLDPAWQDQSVSAVAEGVLAYAKRVPALDTAVAAKRARDEEANERWRQHLASQATKAAESKTLATLSNVLAAAASPRVLAGTNAAPIQIEALMPYYDTEKPN